MLPHLFMRIATMWV